MLIFKQRKLFNLQTVQNNIKEETIDWKIAVSITS